MVHTTQKLSENFAKLSANFPVPSIRYVIKNKDLMLGVTRLGETEFFTYAQTASSEIS